MKTLVNSVGLPVVALTTRIVVPVHTGVVAIQDLSLFVLNEGVEIAFNGDPMITA